MPLQIPSPIPVEVVLDQAVVSEEVSSRPGLAGAAQESEVRRRAASRDAEILRATGPADDLDELVARSARHATLDD